MYESRDNRLFQSKRQCLDEIKTIEKHELFLALTSGVQEPIDTILLQPVGVEAADIKLCLTPNLKQIG